MPSFKCNKKEQIRKLGEISRVVKSYYLQILKGFEENGHRKLYYHGKHYISSFDSLAKVKNQNTQSAIIQK